jgi:retron-type reverse transcriptase
MTGKIPKIWKTSIIRPIPKIQNPTLPADFRPISLLCSTSKILEKIIAKKLTSFLESRNIFPQCQHGFRKNRSVTTQLLETFDDFSHAIDNKKCVDSLYFDLAKAFDTVPHDRLIKKLKSVGITGILLKMGRGLSKR